MMSPLPTRVACPVQGPALCTSTITQGVSVKEAYPTASCMRLNPGPEVAVIALAPAQAAPIMAEMEAISSSIWMNTPPHSLSRTAILSMISLDGVIG